MNNEKEDELIESLSAELKPVRRMLHPFLRFAPAVVFGLVYLAIAVHVVGLRPDMPAKYQDLHFLFEVGLMLSVSLAAFFAAIWLSIPDARGLRWLPAVPLTLFCVMLLWTILKAYIDQATNFEWHWSHCIQESIYITAIPTAAIVFILRKGVTTQPVMMTLMVILAMTGLGYAGLRFTCMMDTIEHVVHYHILPFTVLGAIVGFLARKLFRW